MEVTQCRESRGFNNCGGTLGDLPPLRPRSSSGRISTGLRFLHSINHSTFQHYYIQDLDDRNTAR